ncbi:MAG: hypothetical protein GY941_16855 [Planctomycetes bacterium]|nr:hypothetical protein [Planctomycetota bacterium]
MTTFFQNSTIEHLATILRRETVPLPWSSIVAIQPKGEKLPLFCVHPAGGLVLCYFELAQLLGKDQPFYGLQAFGMEAGQVPYSQVIDMAKYYLNEILTIQAHGPYQLTGWSFGGVVAFEMARQLQAQGETVSLLALLDTPVPSSRQGRQGTEGDAQLLVYLFAEEEISLSQDYMQTLSPDEQLNYVIEQGRRADLFPPEVDLAHAQRFLQVYKRNVGASQRYQPQSYRGKIILLKANEVEDDKSLEPDSCWGAYATQGVEIIQITGNHQNMVKLPHVQGLAEKLKHYIHAS